MTRDTFEKITGAVLGLGGGGIKYTLLQLNPFVHLDFWEKLVPAAITAMVCAVLGVAAVDIYRWIRKIFRKL